MFHTCSGRILDSPISWFGWKDSCHRHQQDSDKVVTCDCLCLGWRLLLLLLQVYYGTWHGQAVAINVLNPQSADSATEGTC
jgi:hypothetical protein